MRKCADCSACKKLAFVTKEHCDKQPKRGTDDSTVIKWSLIVKSTMVEGEKKLIKREKGVEKQFRWSCVGCGLTLGYQSTPWVGDARYVFALKGALSCSATAEGAAKSSKGTDQQTQPAPIAARSWHDPKATDGASA